jgi:hypothetical protein
LGGIILLALGVPAYFYWRSRKRRPAGPAESNLQ